MLHVFHIDAGRMLTFDIGYAAETVSTLQEALSSTVHAPASDQILLISGGEVLDNPERRVSRYSAGTDSNPIFLVCRPTGDLLGQSCYGSSSSPTPDFANTAEIEQQVHQASQSQPTFQTIQSCVQVARRLVKFADTNVERCSQLVYDQHLLHQGWLAVIANLDDTVAAFRQRLTKYRDKIERFSTQRQRAIDLLATFDGDVHLLRRIPLLPCLLPPGELSQSNSSTLTMSLFDWISSKEPEHSLHDLATDARQALDRLLEPRIIENLSALEGATLDRAQDVSMKEIGGLGKRLARLDEYLQHVKKLQVEQRQYAESLRAQEQRAVAANDPSIIADLCLNHLSALEKMVERQKQLADVTRRFCEAKTELLKNIHIRLRWVADTHQLIQTGDSKVMLNGERLYRLRRQLELLRQLHDAPFVYASAVTEVVRRKTFSREFIDWTDKLTDKSKQLCSDENRLRDMFAVKLDHHFLRTLFPGMEDRTPEFAHEPPEPFDSYLPQIEVDHVRELRSAVPQLHHLLCVQKPSVYERVSFAHARRSSSSLQRDPSFFSQTPPRYAAAAANIPVSGSAPIIIHNGNTGINSMAWFAGDEIEFSPTETRNGERDDLFLASVPLSAAVKSDESDEGGQRMTITSDSDSEAMANQTIACSSIAKGHTARSAPIRIPTNQRNNDGISSPAMMTASRGHFSEKGGSSGKFGTPDEHMVGTSLERDSDDDEGKTRRARNKPESPTLPVVVSEGATETVLNATDADQSSRDLSEKARRQVDTLEAEQALRQQLNERVSEVERYRTMLSTKVIPELIELRQFFEEVKRTFEDLTSENEKSKSEWTEVIERAARKLEENLQADLNAARKAEDELRKAELDAAMEELRRELDEERKCARDYQKQLENNEAFLKQKEEVIELLQERLQEQETACSKQLENTEADVMKRFLIDLELSKDALRAEYEREIGMKDAEIHQLKQELVEKQQVLRDMRREQDRLVASMCEREFVCDHVHTPVAAVANDQQRSDDFEDRLRQVKSELEREYKDKLQMLTAGLEAKHAQQLERVRKEKEIELRMLNLQLQKERGTNEKQREDGTVETNETASTSLEAWRSSENVADAILNSVQATTASTVLLFQHDMEHEKESEECAEAEEEDDAEQQLAEKQNPDINESKHAALDDVSSNELVPTKSRLVQTKPDKTKISILRIAKGDLVLLVFDPQFKTFVIFTVSPTLYILKDSCLQRMGCLYKSTKMETTSTSAAEGLKTGPIGESMFPKQRWVLGRVVELDYCQIKKPTNRYRLPMNTRFFRVAAEPVIYKPQP